MFYYGEKNLIGIKSNNLFSHIFIGYAFDLPVFKILAPHAKLCHQLSGNDKSTDWFPNFIMYTVNCNPRLQQTRC